MRRLFSYMPIVAVAVLFSLFSCQSKKGEKQSGDVRLPEISVAYPAVVSVVLIKMRRDTPSMRLFFYINRWVAVG